MRSASGLLIIQRGGIGEERLPTSEALEILIENCDDAYGFPPYTTLERLLHALSGEDLRAKERRLMNEALGRHPAIVLRSETLDWAERIPDVLSEWADI